MTTGPASDRARRSPASPSLAAATPTAGARIDARSSPCATFGETASSRPTLDRLPVDRLRGVGTRLAERLARLGVLSVQDLLLHLPVRYQDRTRVVPIDRLHDGVDALIEGVIESSELRTARRRTLRLRLYDGSAHLNLCFFHFSPRQAAALTPGTRLRCYGQVRAGLGSLEMIHPEYQRLGVDEPGYSAGDLTAVYPIVDGLTQSSLRSLIAQALEWLEREPEMLPEWLPEGLVRDLSWLSLTDALRFLHRPPRDIAVAELLERRHPAHRRLAIEELIAHQLSLRRFRRRRRQGVAPRLRAQDALRQRLIEGLPFALTDAQRRVAAEIAQDLSQPQPMQRLLQGDVGSGKTLVAVLAALQAVEAGYQVALMAPTELLSEQHARNLTAWLEPLGVTPLLLVGRHKGRERARLLERIAAGDVPILVGTHALFQSDVRFERLGLVIIDEQHRFGVEQRMKLLEKGARAGLVPHQLIMTATPIPRSLAMTLYADLDLSVIDQSPPGRQPVRTVAIPDERREQVIERVRQACRAGRQAYWVCTLIDESEVLQCQAAEETARVLEARLADLRVGLIHGRMKGPERDRVMRAFAAGALDLLVATTVIEVGVDVPNASLMIIENPERLGLAQLHQLRGRVGRGGGESHCVLLYHAPLSELARGRLGLLRECSDGFAIARKDLEMRGPGEVLGTRQTGTMRFRVADPLGDEPLLAQAQQIADRLLEAQDHRIDALIRRWVGDRELLGRV
ncbi:ATP-dependent DNA helicase RecG [Thioalkalicoccus limnaeus]|uniref:ATP-dependent DNA helicase RecG n=1 Tax=Thioalkalicoccus limnaeus TaxID=120681 RepID=A0ABV4BEP0_9GAMM